MAEQEVIKHTKKVYKIWTGKQHSFWDKLKEFGIEILIIVFAISLSIWLHERSEHAHQKKETKAFLIGLKNDLTSDIKEMQADIRSYENSRRAYTYLVGLKMNEQVNPDSMRIMQNWFFNETKLVPNIGRFEGFKSSGKIGQIEDNALQTEIMDLYQEDVPALIWGAEHYNGLKRNLKQYCFRNARRTTDSTTNLYSVLTTDEAYNAASDLMYTEEITDRYQKCILTSQSIIAKINKLYNL